MTVNGEPHRFDGETLTVLGMLDALGFAGRRVAVEVNRAIVKRADHAEFKVCDGDVVEIVQFVGGG